MTKLKIPFKLDSKKHFTAQTILELLPKQELNYCEPFCMGVSLFLNKEKSKEEVINDLDVKAINILRTLRDEPKDFINKLKKIKNLEKTFLSCLEKNDFEDYVEESYNEFILRKMSRGNQKKTFSISQESWQKSLEILPKIASRVKEMIILSQRPEKVVEMWNSENCLIYIDSPSEDSNEISLDDHLKILNLAKNSKSKVIISGYSSTLYNRMLKGWKSVKNPSSDKSKTEIVWKNWS